MRRDAAAAVVLCLAISLSLIIVHCTYPREARKAHLSSPVQALQERNVGVRPSSIGAFDAEYHPSRLEQAHVPATQGGWRWTFSITLSGEGLALSTSAVGVERSSTEPSRGWSARRRVLSSGEDKPSALVVQKKEGGKATGDGLGQKKEERAGDGANVVGMAQKFEKEIVERVAKCEEQQQASRSGKMVRGRKNLFEHFDVRCPKDNVVQASDVRRAIIDGLFNGSDPFSGFPRPDVVAQANNFSTVTLTGWDSTYPVFARMVNETRPKVIIEIGSFLGKSAVHLARLTKKLGLNTLILCLDDFRGWPGMQKSGLKLPEFNGHFMLLESFMHNIKRNGLSDRVIPLPFSSGGTLAWFCKNGIRADLIEVDAGHDFVSAWTDIVWSSNLLRPGGIMFGHDYVQSEVSRAVDVFAHHVGMKAERDGHHWIMRPANYSTA